jgi:hypothetical protein
MNGYNGWANYETWRTNLELFDGLDLTDFSLDFDDRDGAVKELTAILEEYADETVEMDAKGWAADIARSFLAQVDFEEIAEHMVDDYITENN